ncbi:O-antigen ligase family protein [Photobacterium swingsii]|uniref:O-antigen ligase family protein n=1 Tax=Photobacterium swingsii TaxID=680026 RepID=UPI00406914FF
MTMTKLKSPQKFIIENIAYLPIIFMFVGMYNLPTGRSITSDLLVIASLILVLLLKSNVLMTLKEKSTKALSIGLSIYLAISLFTLYLHGDDWGLIRGGLICLLFLITSHFFFKKRIIQHSVIVGSLTLLAISLYQLLFVGTSRIDAFTNAIPYAHGTIVLSIFNLYLMFNEENKKLKLLHFLALIAAMICCILSDTRGAWLTIPLLFSILLIYTYRHHNKKTVLTAVFISFIIAAIGISLFNDRISSRLDQASFEISEYNAGHSNSSIGLRLTLWESAFYIFKESPIIGFGDGYKEKRKQQVDEGLYPERINILVHNHNQYVEIAVTRGSLGLISLLLLFSLSLYAIHQSSTTPNMKYLGYSIVVSYMIFGLTDIPLKHHLTLYLYLVSLTFIIKHKPKA